MRPFVEATNRPWFGPKKRAREILTARHEVSSTEEAVDKLRDILGGHFEAIEGFRFIDFTDHTSANFRYTIVLAWTRSDASARSVMYEMAREICRETGWYLLALGEHLGSRRANRRFQASRERKRLRAKLVAPLESIESAVPTDAGCALRLRCQSGSLLFDSGLPGRIEFLDDDRLILISHLHGDHFGGVESGNVQGRDIVVSQSSQRALAYQAHTSVAHLSPVSLPVSGKWVSIGSGCEARQFSVPHTLGSVGYAVRDAMSGIIYTGDISLTGTGYDFTDRLVSLIRQLRRSKRYILLDGTMAGRDFGSMSSDLETRVLELAHEAGEIAIVGEYSDQLVYAYLKLFAKAKSSDAFRSTTDFIIPKSLKPLFAFLHSSFIVGEANRIDPFVLSQFKGSRSAWAESQFLYWYDSTVDLHSPYENARIWFVTYDQLHRLPEVKDVKKVVLGRGLDIAHRLQLDTSSWSLHSTSDQLTEGVRRLSDHARVLLFHNFPKRLNNYIAQNGLNATAIGRTRHLL